jgi:hypothetical protein
MVAGVSVGGEGGDQGSCNHKSPQAGTLASSPAGPAPSRRRGYQRMFRACRVGGGDAAGPAGEDASAPLRYARCVFHSQAPR